MKLKIAPTQQEVQFQQDEIIVSKTDLTGRLTYANRTFMRISNYPEHALLGKQHNIIRHPDMPRGVFKMLWDTLRNEYEFSGYVKNLTAEGHYYWVFANITPDRDFQGKIVGYFSVRRKPPISAINVIQGLYREMHKIEERAGVAAAADASSKYILEKMKSMDTTYDKFVLSLFG